jgi:hypothetical protein
MFVFETLVVQDKPYFESLYEEGSAISQKLHKKREEAEAQRVSACTFAPRLVSKQLVKEGTVMKVRLREWKLLVWLAGQRGRLQECGSWCRRRGPGREGKKTYVSQGICAHAPVGRSTGLNN